jgi:hypothetical protein
LYQIDNAAGVLRADSHHPLRPEGMVYAHLMVPQEARDAGNMDDEVAMASVEE